MTFKRTEPDENFGIRFISGQGRWELGFTQMLYGVRVRLGQAGSVFCCVDYCAGDSPLHQQVIFEMVRIILLRVPETTSEHAMEKMFPKYTVKPIQRDPVCFDRLLEMALQVKAEIEQQQKAA